MSTIAEVLAPVIPALDALAARADEIVEETQYVADLVTVYSGRLGQVVTTRGAEQVPPDVGRAVAQALEEAALVTDPHRAIDWLSTLPQVVLLAVGETA